MALCMGCMSTRRLTLSCLERHNFFNVFLIYAIIIALRTDFILQLFLLLFSHKLLDNSFYSFYHFFGIFIARFDLCLSRISLAIIFKEKTKFCRCLHGTEAINIETDLSHLRI